MNFIVVFVLFYMSFFDYNLSQQNELILKWLFSVLMALLSNEGSLSICCRWVLDCSTDYFQEGRNEYQVVSGLERNANLHYTPKNTQVTFIIRPSEITVEACMRWCVRRGHRHLCVLVSDGRWSTMRATRVSLENLSGGLTYHLIWHHWHGMVIVQRVCVGWRSAGSGLVWGTELVFRSALRKKTWLLCKRRFYALLTVMDISEVAETERVCLRESLAQLTLNYHSIKSSDSEITVSLVWSWHEHVQNLPATSVQLLNRTQAVARGPFLQSCGWFSPGFMST